MPSLRRLAALLCLYEVLNMVMACFQNSSPIAVTQIQVQAPFSLVAALSSTSTTRIIIQVTPVTTPQDVHDLATLRFNEWICDEQEISRAAFGMATADIFQERVVGGAVAFVARIQGTPVGAAELSPMEMIHVLCGDDQGRTLCYVTDVVTCRDHRRMGIGEALMVAIEQKATTIGVTELFLHVNPDNEPALHFYQSQRLGYGPPQRLEGLDIDRLAENAGAAGQILLSKVLSPMSPIIQPRFQTSQKMGGGGFGTTPSVPSRKRGSK
jgi:ribosomal protein S18 acetylase RimI-like enzyme